MYAIFAGTGTRIGISNENRTWSRSEVFSFCMSGILAFTLTCFFSKAYYQIVIHGSIVLDKANNSWQAGAAEDEGE